MAKAATGAPSVLRVIVYREGDMYVAQGLEHDIAAQGRGLNAALDRLDMTIEAEIAMRGGAEHLNEICQAPPYYHKLWDERSADIQRVQMDIPPITIQVALAQAA